MPLVLTNRRRRGGSASAPAFSPSTLYSSGSQGIWLDPSDLSTMFSDRAGTTPVTTPGTVVGLRLDKSKGLTLGAELVTNGDFAAGSTGWTEALNGTISYASQTMLATGTTGNTGVYRDVTVVANKSYKVAWRQVSGTNNRINAYDGAGFGTSLYNNVANFNVAGDYTAVVRPSSTVIRIYAHTQTGGVAEFDNISVRELAGNHAVAPTDAARPIYGVEPKGGRRNLLLATNTLATQSLTVTAVAHTLAFTGTGTVTLSGASTAGPLVGTGAGNRVSLTFTPTAASLTLTVSGSVTLGQLELGSSATAYQTVVTVYNITESGVATCHYVQFDGSDDSMSTAAIDFTATDKMSVFAGVRKLSDGGRMLLELSTDVAASVGTFYVAPGTDTGVLGTQSGYSSVARANAAVSASQNAQVVAAAPESAVLAITHDIVGDLSTIRRNGVAGTSATGDKGTGNFGSYPLFIGRRANFSLPFNGRDFGIIIVGKAASAGEITDTETWLAARTSGVSL